MRKSAAFIAIALILGGIWFFKRTEAPMVEKQNQTGSRGIASTSSFCLFCQFPKPNYPNANSNKVCEDLFEASCQAKSANSSEDLEREKYEEALENKEKAAQAMGHKSFDDGLKKQLQEAGVKIKPNLSQDEWEELKHDLLTPGGLPGTHIHEKAYEGTFKCAPDRLASGSSNSKSLGTTIKNLNAERNRRNQRIRADLVAQYSGNIPGFLENHILPKCEALGHEAFLPENNERLYEVCDQFSQIRREAIMLYRQEGTPEYSQNAARFIEKYYTPQPVAELDMPPAGNRNQTSNAQKFISLNSTMQAECQEHIDVIHQSAKKAAQNYASELNRSRFNVERTIATVYNDRRKRQAQDALNVIRSDVQALVPQLTSDPRKQNRIIDEYNRVDLYWMQPPSADAYTTNAQGKDILRPTTENDDPRSVPAIFSDPSLSYFSEPNAFYSPQMIVGDEKLHEEHINISPGFLELIEKNPHGFSSVLAHELGHKIGPAISKGNGHDMTAEYKDLLQCYKDRGSIRLQDKQSDEAIADYVSSEIMAYQVSKLPQSERRSAIMSMASVFCDGGHSPIECNGLHPESVLRVNGILGANPNIRKVMGCGPESKNFKTCGLKDVSLLGGEEAAMSSSEPTSSSDDIRGVE